jgi:hypothetical protein
MSAADAVRAREDAKKPQRPEPVEDPKPKRRKVFDFDSASLDPVTQDPETVDEEPGGDE